uniref:Proline and serine rich 2 n=1 Tax=Catagonus wagneri TaxID=51154 RepID=A0A8C3YSZ2_9CETA
MPVNHQKSDSWEMDPDSAPSCKLGDLSRGSSLDSRTSSSRSRSLTLDDESLKYLTHEEKDVLLFFEETIDSLEDDFGEQVPGAGDAQRHSPPSLDESTSGPSEPEGVTDLVQLGPGAGEPESLQDVTEAAGSGPVGKEDIPVLGCGRQNAEKTPPPDPPGPEAQPQPPSPPAPAAAPLHPRREPPLPPPPAEHPKLPRSVPTPLVIAQKMAEKLAGNEALSPTSPSREGRPGEWRVLASGAPRHADASPWHRHAAQPKIHRFPSNISLSNSAGRDFNKTISKAAVNVQERKAQVLANINGVSLLSAGETEDGAQRGDLAEQRRSVSPEQSQRGPGQQAVPVRAGAHGTQQSRGVQTEQPLPLANGFQTIHDVLRSQAGPFIPTGKTVTFCPDPALPSKLASRPPDCSQDIRKRSGSLPRAVGFRPQGITVQFSGRGSTEEARREALRKLGLLKENL